MRRVYLFALAIGLLMPVVGVPAAGGAPLPYETNLDKSHALPGPGDVTVVAVIDFTFSPYHWDFLGSRMPQNIDGDRSNDIPLERSPDTWLPGFPSTKSFASFASIDITLDEKNASQSPAVLDAKDKAKWEKVKESTGKKINYYWLPGTKVIGAIEFGSNKIHGSTSEHGTGVSSVSVGNFHGTCPECVLVFIDVSNAQDTEAATKWAAKQPWIDVVSNSYGNGDTVPKIYNGDTETATRTASERGQTIFFSAGNGFENAFTVTNPTYMSSEKGPDWIVTVGAVSPGNHGSYVGHGKPADVASLGSGYPSAYGSPSVSGEGNFSGTSNASPTTAGIYARALSLARADLSGSSRIQKGGVIAYGGRYSCGSARRKCELGSGQLTAAELRTRLFEGAIHTSAGATDPLGAASAPPVGEDEFLSEGHGTYFALESGDFSEYLKEFARVLGPLEGRSKTLERPAGEKEWMIVDSFCRQHLWGEWRGGYYFGKAKLPGPDPMYPIRSYLEESCPAYQPPP